MGVVCGGIPHQARIEGFGREEDDDKGRIRDIFLTGPTCVVCEGELYELEK